MTLPLTAKYQQSIDVLSSGASLRVLRHSSTSNLKNHIIAVIVKCCNHFAIKLHNYTLFDTNNKYNDHLHIIVVKISLEMKWRVHFRFFQTW